MRKFATPSVLALEFFANIGERLGMNRAQQFVCDFAKRLLTRIAVQFARAIIPISDAVLPVAYENRFVGEIQQPRLFGQTPLCLFLFRDIARNFGNTDNLALRTLDRRNGERNVDQPAVFAAAHCLVVVD
jgi:hypothetical protein